jgi:hypothetical protein
MKMEYDEKGHVKVKPRDYPKPMHDGKGNIMHARDGVHESELRRDGYSPKIYDKEVHGKASVA